MSPTEILALLGGSGGGAVGLVMLSLFITGHIVPKSRVSESKAELEAALSLAREEREEWRKVAELERQRADVERQRADAGVLAGQIAKDIMIGLRKEIVP
jgi:hypothetical protein